MGGNIKQVALLLRTSGASTQSTQHTAHSAWHTALTQYTLHNHKRDSTTSITMSVLRTMWLWTHKPITAQIMDGCRLKHLKNGDPVNDAIGEQNPWRQCIHFQFSPFLVVQNFPWAWLLIIGNIPHCWFYYPSRWIESTSKMQQEGRETVPCICDRSFISSFVRVWDAKLISRATVAFIVCSLYAQATAQYKSQPGVNQLEWGEKYDGVDNALAEQKSWSIVLLTLQQTIWTLGAI